MDGSRGCEPVAKSVLKAQLLGQVLLAIDERRIDDEAWPPRGGRELLLLLLTSPGHRLSRDRVLEALWPDLPPHAARNACYKAMHSLKRMLEPGLQAREAGHFLRSSGDWLTLSIGSIQVDVDAFEQELVFAERTDESGRLHHLQAAMALYRGELLEDEPGVDWAHGRREHLRQLWQRAGLRIAELALAAGTGAEALDPLHAILIGDPTNEAAHRLLMRAYDMAGRRDLALRQYEHCVAALRDDLGVEPSAETRRVATRLLDPSRVHTSTPRHQRWATIPTPATRLIGRESELERLSTIFHGENARLVTLTGPGGVGKTRLALEAARQLADDFADGACFVALAALREAPMVPATIAQAIGLRDERAKSSIEAIKAALRDREALLFLDNFEQVRKAAPFVAEILEACPGLRVLVTSREPLHLRAERLLPVSPLAVAPIRREALTPARLMNLERSDAVALFLERARAVAPELRLTSANAVAVVRICERLDGLPLAIELAAARVREHDPGALLELMTDRLGTLVDGYQDLPARQQTMRATLAWSYELLEPRLQRTFRGMAIFSSGCTPELAARISGERLQTASEVLRSLVDKCLARWREDAPTYAVMLETTREFALERLEETDEGGVVRHLHGDYALELTSAAAEQLASTEQAVWLNRLDVEHDTLRSALAWSIAAEDAARALTLAGNLWRYWWSRGHLSEGRSWLERALSLPGTADLGQRGFALNGAASLAESQGDFARAAEYHQQALAHWRARGDLGGEARALSGLGTVAAHQGEFARARVLHEQSLVLSRRAGDLPGTARVLDRLGTVARHEGQLGDAETAYSESLTLFQAAGDLVNASIVLSNLGEVLQVQGRVEFAAQRFEEALRLERELDLPDGIAFDLMNLARVRLELGEIERAAALIGQSVRLFDDMGNQLGLANALAVSAAVNRASGDHERARTLLGESLGILSDLDERSAMPEHLELLAAALGDAGLTERALRVLGAADAMRSELGTPPPPTDRAMIDRLRDLGKGMLGERAANRAVDQGRASSRLIILQEAISRSPSGEDA